MEFTIQNEAREVTTSGYTVQLMLDVDRNLLMFPPSFYCEFLERWRNGGLA
jgi:acyl-CoA thioester hydrolase